MNKPKAQLIGMNGNIFNLIGLASRALKKAGMNNEARELRDKVMNEAKSYDEALRIIMDYVEVE